MADTEKIIEIEVLRYRPEQDKEPVLAELQGAVHRRHVRAAGRAVHQGLPRRDGEFPLVLPHGDLRQYKARRRVAILKGILSEMGFTENRIWFRWISASEGKLFADTVTKMVDELKKMGPNPVKQLWNA